MEYYKKLNFLLILIVVITGLLIHLYLYREKLHLLFIKISIIAIITLGILIFIKKKHKKIGLSLNYDFSFLGYTLGIILVIGVLFSILGLSKDIFYKEQLSFIPYFFLACVVFLLGIALFYFSYMTKQKKCLNIKKRTAIKRKKLNKSSIALSILLVIFILSQGVFFTFLSEGSLKIVDAGVLVFIFLFCLIYILIKRKKMIDEKKS